MAAQLRPSNQGAYSSGNKIARFMPPPSEETALWTNVLYFQRFIDYKMFQIRRKLVLRLALAARLVKCKPDANASENE